MLKLSQPNISDDAIAAVAEVLRSGQLVHGPENEAFESELAAYLGCSDVVLVSSGTAALHVALIALGIGPGDAVIVPDFTFPATANVVAILGAKLITVDVDPETYTLAIDKLASTIEDWQGEETLKAVIPVHEFGCAADMKSILKLAEKHNLFVVEDAACALGASYDGSKVGALGDVGCFSFHPRKTLTTGEGGALATNNKALAQTIRRLKNHGMERSSVGMQFYQPGLNYRLTNFQAALGRFQLPELEQWISTRYKYAQYYIRLLEPLRSRGCISLPTLIEGHSFQTFMIVLEQGVERGKVIEKLRSQDVEASLGAQSLMALNIYPDAYSAGFSVSKKLFQYGLALPFCEKNSLADIENVVSALESILSC
ncbi:MAG: DegT/DnrJ/EryC1/StrS family aminotransferase [Halioglobus sp.]